MAKDLTGMRFGRLVVLSRADDNISQSGYRTVMWNCVCDCGSTTTVRGKCLTGGVTKSCGCFARENMSRVKKKHGGSGTRLYAIWDSMRQRCFNKNNRAYHNYGGRGISVCEEWDDFSKFREWASSSGYDSSTSRGICTLDRIDVNEGYSPENCRWVTMKEQSNNKRNTVRIEFAGRDLTVKEWAAETGINYYTLWARYNKGYSPEQILSQKHLH